MHRRIAPAMLAAMADAPTSLPVAMDAGALTAFLRSDFPQVGDAFEVVAVTPEGCDVRLIPDASHLRPGGTVSGPSMFALADVGAYLAILSRAGPVALAVTTGASIDFMRKPPAGGALTCRTRLLKLGRSLAVCDALIEGDGLAGPVARASMTYALPPDTSGDGNAALILG